MLALFMAELGGFMREIKFRCIKTSDNSDAEGLTVPAFSIKFGDTFTLASGKDGGVVQYTGLIDRDKKEVFEGDIVKIRGEIKEVKWSEIDVGFKYFPIFDKHGEIWSPESGYDTVNFDFTEENQSLLVIGNIYENPNLMKGEI